MLDLSQYFAKNKKSIAEHNEDLFSELSILKEFGYIKSGKIYKLTKLACYSHDIGKVNAEFQNRIRNHTKFDSSKEVAHNVLSLYLIDPNLFENMDDYYSVAHAVLNHHDYCNTFEVLQNEETKRIIEQLLTPFDTFPLKLRTIKNIKKKVTDHDSILVKGFLHKCDYSASSGITIEYKNDFLENELEYLLMNWKKVNENVEWNDLQYFCIENRNNNVITVAQTGMGKTEAGLLWVGNNKGFYILPIITAINAIYDRIKEKVLHNHYIDERLGLMHSNALEYHIQNTKTEELDIIDYYNKSKHLSMPLNISTLDQLFDFVFKYQGYELKLATLSYSKVVIDEIQMYSPDLLAYLIYGLKRINEFGGKIAIITATFPPFIKDLLAPIEFKEGVFLNDIKRHHIKVYKEQMSSQLIYEKYLENIKKNVSNKILIVCNTVKKAQEMYENLKLKFKGVGNIQLIHSRFTQKDRSKKEKAIITFGETYNKDGTINFSNGIWISTQIVEASLDIDFDFLFTELSDLNGLFQRLGRCNRKGVKPVEFPNCYIFSNIDPSIIRRGTKGFIDETIYKLSKEVVDNISGILTEESKVGLINEIFTSSKLQHSNYMDEYRSTYQIIDGLYDYEIEKSEVDLRNILSYSIIPYSIYIENLDIIEKQLESLRDKKADRITRVKSRERILQYTVSIPCERYQKARHNKLLTIFVDIDKYTSIPVVHYQYNGEIGLKFEEDIQ